MEESTQKLAVPVEAAYFLNMCNACQNALASKVVEINRRIASGEMRLAALAYKLFRSSVACGIADTFTKCNRWAGKGWAYGDQDCVEMYRSSSCSQCVECTYDSVSGFQYDFSSSFASFLTFSDSLLL